MIRRLVVAGLLLVVTAWSAPALAQCAMCRTALDSPEGRQLIAALRSGVLVLLVIPAMAFATVAWVAVRGQRALERDPDKAPVSVVDPNEPEEAS